MEIVLEGLKTRLGRLELPLPNGQLFVVEGKLDLDPISVSAASSKTSTKSASEVDGRTTVCWQRGSLTEVQAQVGELLLTVERIEMATGVVELVAGQPVRVTLGPTIARGVAVRGPWGQAALDAVELPDGVVTGADGVVTMATLVLTALKATWEPKAAPSTGGSLLAEPAEALRALLDVLEGRLDVDVDLALSVPIIQHRKATHQFRLAIEHGTIDYKNLESGLAWVENAVIDLELRGDRLILEKDLPLVPFDNQTLLSWQLQPYELEMATAGRVRLARLAQPEPAAPPKNDKPSSVQVEHVQARLLDLHLDTMAPLALALSGGGTLNLGSASAAGISGLTIGGEARYQPGEGENPIDLRVELATLVASCAGLLCVGRKLSIGAGVLSTLSAGLALDGARLKQLAFSANSVRVDDLRLT